MKVALITDTIQTLERFAEKVQEPYPPVSKNESLHLAERAMRIGIISHEEYADYIRLKCE